MNYNLPYEYRKNNNLKYSTYVWQLFMDSKYRFWVGTRNGLLLFDRETKNFSPVLTVEGKPLEKHSIRAIVEGLNGELWIGTPDGLYKLVLNVEGKAEIKGNYEVAVGTAAPVCPCFACFYGRATLYRLYGGTGDSCAK